MKKIWLIIQREYITRVRNKTFLLSTFLTPLLFAGVFAIIIFITVKGQTTDRVAFRDNTGIFQEQEYKRTGVVFISDPEADTSNYLSKGYSAIVYAPNFGINNTDKWQVYSKKNFGLIQSEAIRDIIRNEYERYVFREQGIDVSLLDSVKKASGSLSVETAIIGQGEEIKKGNSGIAYGVG